MAEIPFYCSEYLEREVAILNKMAQIRNEIEEAVESGTAEIGFLIRSQVELGIQQKALNEIKKEKENLNDPESDIPTIRPPKPHADMTDENSDSSREFTDFG